VDNDPGFLGVPATAAGFGTNCSTATWSTAS